MGETQRKSTAIPGWVWAIIAIAVGFMLLIFIGIIAAIAIPNLLEAKNRAATRVTMQEIRQLATAMETYAVDTGRYPQVASAAELVAVLQEKQYGTKLVSRDAWGHPFLVEVSPDGAHYCIISMGQDGLREARAPYSDLPEENEARGADIVFQDSIFVSYPAGANR